MGNQLRLLTLIVIACLACCTAVFAQTTTFTYQGRLTDGGTPANGDYDLLFNMWNSPSGGTLVHSQTFNNVRVTNGVFTVSLDFGASSFGGPNRFLEIGAKLVGSSSFTFVNPRQQITSTPYAIRSLSAASADSVPASGVSAGSSNYIQNTTTQQSSSNFNITGNGTAGGTLTGNVVNAANRFDLGGNRILSAGSENLFLGFDAGVANTTGNQNSFFGQRAGRENTTGNGNSFFGFRAGSAIRMGSFNSIFGSQALELAGGSGDFNSFFGHRAGETNRGSFNSFFGTGAGLRNSGDRNTFVGHDAGRFNESGSFNTMLGDNANVFQTSLTNATAIGANALVTQNNSLVLGSINGVNLATADTNVGIGTTAPLGRLQVATANDTNPSSVAAWDSRHFVIGGSASGGGIGLSYDQTNNVGYISSLSPNVSWRNLVLQPGGGNVGIGTGTTAPAHKLHVNGTVAGVGPYVDASDLRYKRGIRPIADALAKVLSLRGVTFDWRREEFPALNFAVGRSVGFVAQEVEQAVPEVVTRDAEGFRSVAYSHLTPVLVEAVKEQQAQIENQQKLIETQQQQIEALKKLVCATNRDAGICKQ